MLTTPEAHPSATLPLKAQAALASSAVPLTGKALVGLIGVGIQQSLTPAMHEAEARHHGLHLHYQLIDLAVANVGTDKLPMLLDAAKVMGFAGLNITFPCKQAVIPLLDDVSDEARVMGAVNTVVIRDGRAVGHNTDGSGWAWHFKRSLPQADLSRVVLLGSGGAGSAIAHAMLRMCCARGPHHRHRCGDGPGQRPGACHTDGHGQDARHGAEPCFVDIAALGVRSGVLSHRDGVAESCACCRLRRVRRRRHGRGAGGRGLQALHGIGARHRTHAGLLFAPPGSARFLTLHRQRLVQPTITHEPLDDHQPGP
jgi:Shikimate dehydrogenase substrate binding domain